MKKINFDEKFEIYLFDTKENATYSSMLNEFMAFLKFNKASVPYKFSYVDKGPNLISEMTINQNILIDFNADSLTESKDAQFHEFLKDSKNYYLSELYNKLEIPTELPKFANAQMKKIASLIKALLKEGEFIFLESPEEDLSPEALTLFVGALKSQINTKKQNIFIYSENTDFWYSQCHKKVERNPDFSFKTELLTHSILPASERESFYNRDEIQDEDVLVFKYSTRATAQAQKNRKSPKIKIA